MQQLIVFLTAYAILMASLVFDWTVQTTWESKNKFTDPLARGVHSLIYATLTALLFWFFPYYDFFWGDVVGAWALLFITHFFIDDRKAVMWWMVHVKRIPRVDVYPGPNGEWPKTWWLQIGIDQCFHIAVNFVIAMFIAYSL